MKKLLLFFTLLFAFILFALFSDKANDVSRPYLANFIASQSEAIERVEISHYRLDPNHLSLKAKVNDAIDVDLTGDLGLLTQAFDLNYSVNWDEQGVDVAGIVRGSIDEIFINGAGDALDSKVDYALELNEQKPRNIQINVEDGAVEKLLTLAGEPNYANGVFDLHIDMPKISQTEGTGEAKLTLKSIKPNRMQLEKDFELDLPDTTITGVINSRLNGVFASMDGDIQSGLADLHLHNGQVNLETMAVSTGFVMDIDELQNLQPLTQSDLRGELKLQGKLKKDEKSLRLDAQTMSLGGQAKLAMINDKLNIDLERVALDKLLAMLAQPTYLKGSLNGKVALKSLSNLDGKVTLSTKSAQVAHHVVNEAFDFKLKKPLPIQLNVNADISQGNVQANTRIESRVADLLMQSIQYDINNSQLDADYHVSVPDLAQLEGITGRALRGSLDVGGRIKQRESLQVRGETESFGGKIDFILLEDDLQANIAAVPLRKLFETFDYPQIFSAPLSGTLVYNLMSETGHLKGELPNAQLIQNQLANLVKQLSQVDLTREVYNQTDIDAKLQGDIINFDFTAKSRKSHIKLSSAKLNKATDRIDAKYSVTIGKKDIAGALKGPVHKPRVTVESSQFLKSKVKDKINDYMEREGNKKIEERLKDFGLDSNQSQKAIDQAKDFIKGLF